MHVHQSIADKIQNQTSLMSRQPGAVRLIGRTETMLSETVLAKTAVSS